MRSADSAAIYVEPGYLLFVDGETLMAQRFAPSSGELEGQPVPLAHGLYSSSFGFPSFSASRDVLAYREGTVEHRLEWFDRTGTSLGRVGEPGLYQQVVLSHDGRRAIVRARGGSLWLLDLERGGIATRLNLDGLRAGDPTWSPDGKEIVMSAFASNSNDLYRLSLAAGAEPELVLSAEQNLWVDQWLAADNQVVFHDGYSISLLPMDGGEPRELVTQQDRLDEPCRSRDGQWLAFISDETGRLEVYVERLDTRELSRISTERGGQPRWRADGKELFYLGSDGTAMAVDMDPELGVRGVARPLFETPIDTVVPNSDQWDVHPNGDRFLFLVSTGTERPIHVVLNWTALLEEN